jgi:hypothetical protein
MTEPATGGQQTGERLAGKSTTSGIRTQELS